MVILRKLDGLERAQRVLSSVAHRARVLRHRTRVALAEATLFGVGFLTSVILETSMAVMMLSILQIEILGHVVSGALFALLVPIVIGAAHIKMHHDGDWFIRFWLKRLSGIGILLFAVGMSFMVGFAAWQATQDVTAGFNSGPIGTIGGATIASPAAPTSGLLDRIAPLPNALLFLGLSFGMIITIYFASFCLGRVIEALTLITETPRIGKQALEKVRETQSAISAMRKLQRKADTARHRLPFDPKHKFAREAAHVFWQEANNKLAVAKRKFAPSKLPDPLLANFRDREAETIPDHFNDHEAFARHIADEMDAMRAHRIVQMLDGQFHQGENHDL